MLYLLLLKDAYLVKDDGASFEFVGEPFFGLTTSFILKALIEKSPG